MDSAKPNRIPSMTIDEALRQFITTFYPQGIPPGEEGEELIRTIREKISQERPEWAESQKVVNTEKPGPLNYANVKANITHQANQEELPEDPEERYLFLRRQEAANNSKIKRQEEKENQIKEQLKQKLIRESRSADEEVLKKALLIRKTLEQKLKQGLAPEIEKPKNKKPDIKPAYSPPSKAPAKKKDVLKMDPSSFLFTKKEVVRKPPDLVNKMGKLISENNEISMDIKKEMICEYNRTRKAMLKPRESYLSPRFPDKVNTSDDSVETDIKNDMEMDSDRKYEGNNFKLSNESRSVRKDRGLTL